MDGVTVTLERYDSKFFPVMIKWKVGQVEHRNVFETNERAINYCAARFGKLKVIDHIGEGEEQL